MQNIENQPAQTPKPKKIITLRSQLTVVIALIYIMVSTITTLGIYLGLRQVINNASAQSDFINIIVIVFVIVTMLGALGGFLMGNALGKPIQELAMDAERIATGEYSHRTSVQSNNETGILAASFNQLAEQVESTISSLEEKVAERTAQLEARTQDLEAKSEVTTHHLAEFRAIADVARTISRMRTLESLLPEVTKRIAESMGFYHVGIFLASNNREYVVLRATNSEGGTKMLTRGHQIRVGGAGVVSRAASWGNAMVVNNTQSDVTYMKNPDLPDTKSEAAIPLRADNMIIGVLDVQSTEIDRFLQEEIDILNVLADQVAIAIQNTRLYEETQKALADADAIYRQYVHQQWKETMEQQNIAGLQYKGFATEILAEPVVSPSREIVVTQEALAVPITLRNEVIGVINVRSNDKRPWNQDDMDIAGAVAERVAIALENVRLLQDSQQRAVKEQTIGKISTKIGASINLRSVLQTAVEELGLVLTGSEISIQLKKE